MNGIETCISIEDFFEHYNPIQNPNSLFGEDHFLSCLFTLDTDEEAEQVREFRQSPTHTVFTVFNHNFRSFARYEESGMSLKWRRPRRTYLDEMTGYAEEAGQYAAYFTPEMDAEIMLGMFGGESVVGYLVSEAVINNTVWLTAIGERPSGFVLQ